MATYAYKCVWCEKVEEHSHGMNEVPSIKCSNCGAHCEKYLTPEYTGMSRRTGDSDLTDWEEVKYRRHG